MMETHSYHLPVYVCTTKHNDHNNYKFVDGYTGKYFGDIIYSLWKTGFAGGVGGLMFTGLMIASRINPFTSIGMTAGLCGIVSGTWTTIAHKWRYYKYQKYVDQVVAKNTDVEETKEDIELKQINQSDQSDQPEFDNNEVIYPIE